MRRKDKPKRVRLFASLVMLKNFFVVESHDAMLVYIMMVNDVHGGF